MTCNSNPTTQHTLADDERIKTHPCYSKDAHQYARLHLPVAPACNIQCNYCNRKFDCSNESRPGVVSRVMSPLQAIERFKKVKARMPELKVVGIAGPGDALANPNATFTTLKGVSALDSDLHLCISTNGLALPEHVDELTRLGVNHLTVTINTVRPEIAADLYPWIYFKNRRLFGMEAAEILINRQLNGLEIAAKAGMLVKVNTVLIPGVTDRHVEALSTEIKKRGALLHNLMPLISEPSHGTFFGMHHVMGPSASELEYARTRSAISMPQMSHCKQCRADAEGRLEEQSDQQVNAVTVENQVIRVAVAQSQQSLINVHFGHANGFDIYQLFDGKYRFLEHRSLPQFCTGGSECNDVEDKINKMIITLSDCSMVLASRVGISPWVALEKAGIRPNVEYAMCDSHTALAALATQHKSEVLAEVSNGC
ncbi:nitrogenase cofactor biosynthesis protein NifB [Echinimonas agarilytica]|uniref:FeMo cofactor biosynthesis protein NifB n=1 Tax=Echinimonas agarilytica TaxID=1215918 RepID=A0AA41W897_9GAMM|nr:nitrogenase cofactor biosynthesis protein NifB [Echinimonas agarilytica]MCM2680458.1 nitrogenase cofactor biosynthesis protein NifB [Echinimonas agarilytica]